MSDFRYPARLTCERQPVHTFGSRLVVPANVGFQEKNSAPEGRVRGQRREFDEITIQSASIKISGFERHKEL
jgi:hypothetical protein